MKYKVINKSHRELPEEIANACGNMSIGEINDIAEEYNLKIIEYEKVFEECKLVEETFTIGDYARE